MSERPQKVSAGRYKYRGRWIIRTSWDGPRGGTIWRWEIGNDDPYGGVVIDGLESFRTMREVIAVLDREVTS